MHGPKWFRFYRARIGKRGEGGPYVYCKPWPSVTSSVNYLFKSVSCKIVQFDLLSLPRVMSWTRFSIQEMMRQTVYEGLFGQLLSKFLDFSAYQESLHDILYHLFGSAANSTCQNMCQHMSTHVLLPHSCETDYPISILQVNMYPRLLSYRDCELLWWKWSGSFFAKFVDMR